MKEGPVIASVAALLGDPARANILTALMDGRALTVSELAEAAGVTLQTASGHLAKLDAANLLVAEKQGRHRYFRLSGPDVAQVSRGPDGPRPAHGRDPRADRPEGCGAAIRPRLLRPPRRRAWRRHAQGSAASGLHRRQSRPGSDRQGPHLLRRFRDRSGRAGEGPPPGLPRLPRLERAAQPSRRRARCRDPSTG